MWAGLCREAVLQQRCFVCAGVHYGEAEGLVSVERWSCSRGASCVVEYTMGRLRDWSLKRGGLVADVLHVWWSTLWGG